MGLDEKNKYIENYVREIAANVNYKYSIDLINEEKISHIITKFYNSQDDLETDIIPKIDKSIQEIVDNFLIQLMKLNEADKTNSSKSAFTNSFDTKTKSSENEIHLSPLMVSVLSLINCSSVDEINQYIDSVPNLYMMSPIPKAHYNPELLEAIKKNIFKIIQSSLISLDAYKIINGNNKEAAMRYILHKQLSGLKLSIEEEVQLGDIGLTNGLNTLNKKIEEICIKKYGKEEGSKISNKIVNYYTTAFDNFKVMTYEQIKNINEGLKTNGMTLDKQLIRDNNNNNNIVKLKCIKNDLNEFTNWKQEIKQFEQQSTTKRSDINQLFQQHDQTPKIVENPITKQISKPKTKVFTSKSTNHSNVNRGFSNIMVILLSFMVSFICGVLLILICSFYK